ncbi:hypothetical protein CPC08DRAFT_767724 [Agrocybe pediades]|nr:hypothetical protein CPC08DRAFT_767724 [Agrocybe pediades]
MSFGLHPNLVKWVFQPLRLGQLQLPVISRYDGWFPHEIPHLDSEPGVEFAWETFPLQYKGSMLDGKNQYRVPQVFPTMSTTDNFPFSVAQQKALISANLNSTLLLQFLFGIYTGVFPATIYIYIYRENRTRARDRIIIGTTAALYCLTAVNTVINWLYTDILGITRNATRVEMFIESAIQDIPLGEEIIRDLTFFAAFVLADGLLVWRCFHSCGRSFRRSLLPIALLMVEIVLALTVNVYRCLLDTKPNFATRQTEVIFNHLSATTFVAVAATSLVSTAVICLQIWRRTTLVSRSRKRYRTIINALIESSALYTVTVIFSAVLAFNNTGIIKSSFRVVLISYFDQAATQIISGLAPTLMIARLFVSSGQEDTELSSARLPTDLIGRTAHATGDNIVNVGCDLEMQQSGSTPVGEGESEEIKPVARMENEAEVGRVTTFV